MNPFLELDQNLLDTELFEAVEIEMLESKDI